VTESRICQIHSQAIAAIRSFIEQRNAPRCDAVRGNRRQRRHSYQPRATPGKERGNVLYPTQANGLPHRGCCLGAVNPPYEAGFQPAIVLAAHEPRALPWAGMSERLWRPYAQALSSSSRRADTN